MDLAKEWRSRRWKRLLRIIDQLPAHSRLAEARLDDEQVAEQILAFEDKHPNAKPSRRVSDFTPEVDLLSTLVDRVGELTQAVVAAAGAQPRKVTPVPRPKTAVDRVRARRSLAKHRRLVARVLPHRAGQV